MAKTDTIVKARLYDELIPGKIKLDDEDVQKLSKPLSKIELHKSLGQCKIETVSGIDQISSNMLKIGDEVSVNWLKVIADQIWESEVIPKDWKCQIVIPIHKNGSKSLCQNYRGIFLLCVASKVFGRAVLNRLQDKSTEGEPVWIQAKQRLLRPNLFSKDFDAKSQRI